MEMQDRHAAILGELSELSLSLARDLHQAALEAEEPAQKAALASSFHKLSRSVRQTLALEAKLHRDMQADAQRAQNEAAHAAGRVRQKRKDAIQEEVSRLIWTESERSDHDNDELEEDLEAILIFNDLPDLPDQEIIRQIADRLGLKSPRPSGERVRVRGGAANQPPPSPQPASALNSIAETPQQPAAPSRPSPRSSPPRGEEEAGWPPPERVPTGLPGEFGPNGETGEDRILPPI